MYSVASTDGLKPITYNLLPRAGTSGTPVVSKPFVQIVTVSKPGWTSSDLKIPSVRSGGTFTGNLLFDFSLILYNNNN